MRRLVRGSGGRRFWRYGILSLSLTVILLLALSAYSASLRNHAAPVMFTDIATAGLADVRARSEGACWGDYDADGDPDLFVANDGGPSRLWRNDGAGRFTETGEQAGIGSSLATATGCAFIDVDSDGRLDLFVSAKNHLRGSRSTNKLYRNSGNGTFADVTVTAGVGMPGNGMAASDWTDYDGDGDYDGFVASRLKARTPESRVNAFFEQVRPFVFRNIGETNGLADPVGPQKAFLGSWFDYDADGDPDLLLALDFWGIELYRNDGGTFTHATATAFPPAGDKTPGSPPNNPMGVTWGDYDGDGCFDVFITGANMYAQGGFAAESLGDLASRLYRNNCNGTFTDVTSEAGLGPTGVIEWSANFIDFDNDGDLDLSVVAGNASEDVKLKPNRWKAFFKRPVIVLVSATRRVLLAILPAAPRLAEWAYRAEFMVPAIGATGVAAAMPNFLYQSLLVETGRPTFVNVNDKLYPADFGSTQGSAWADIDNDGDLDWFVPNRGTANRLYRNDGPVGHYLRVHVVGAPLRDGVGTWIRIRTGHAFQVRHVHILDGHLSQSQRDPHFGLGEASVVEQIWVRWPGTTAWVPVCTGVPANRTVTISRDGECTW